MCEKEKEKYQVDWTQLDVKYNKAKEQLAKIMPFEKRLSDLDAKEHQKRAAIYLEYITDGKEYLNDQIVQVLYERMVTECCLNRKKGFTISKHNLTLTFLSVSRSSQLLAWVYAIYSEPQRLQYDNKQHRTTIACFQPNRLGRL